MTTLLVAREAMYQRFVDNTALASANYTFDNEAYTPPADATWARFTVRHLDSNQESLGDIGNRKYERLGLIIVQVFSPLDTGARAADTVVQATRTIFEGVTASEIRYYDAVIRELGPVDGWNQTNLEISFVYNETK